MHFFRKKKIGYTLVELLVVITLFLIIGSAIFYLVIEGLRWFVTFSGTEKQEISTEFNVDLLVFDLKHAGYGISQNETTLILSYCNGTANASNPACNAAKNLGAEKGKLLLIKETTNVVRSQNQTPTVGFVLWNGSQVVYAGPNNANSSEYQCIWLKKEDKSLVSQSTCDKALYNNGTKIPFFAVGYPLDPKACGNGTNPLCCADQNCTGIAYFLDIPASGLPQRCLTGTYIFYRKIPGGNNNIYKIPVLNCVADWDVWFEVDTDNDTITDAYYNVLPNDAIRSNIELKQKLVAVDIYFLVQASYSPNYKYDFSKGNRNVNATGAYIIADSFPDGTQVKLKFPEGDEWRHYHWKVFKVRITDFPNLKF
jgi:hypothetical protein